MKSILVFAALFLCVAVTAADKPNIIVIMADDLGYETLGANGGTSFPTPHLDALAKGGARFTHFYAQPLCTPTRIQLMTGQYNVRNYINFGSMDPQSITFGNLLKDAGYATCVAGKWQLGREKDLPQRFGFQEACLWQHTRRPPRYCNPGLEINGVKKDYVNGEYGPDLVQDFALKFIEKNKATPFFLYYPMILTHDPYQPTPDSAEWDPKTKGESAKTNAKHFGEMVTYMDKHIGGLTKKLDELGLREKTLLIFLGDNGSGKGAVSMMGDVKISGGKGTTKKTGMHVPFIASWPGRIQAGTVYKGVSDTVDVLPTLLDAAGVAAPEKLSPLLDGRSVLPQMRGEAGQPRNWLYSWYSPRQTKDKKISEFAYTAQFKLYRGGNFFDLEADPEEKSPIAIQALKGPAADAAKLLQEALDKYKNARPANLD